jgi:hypothetical protein
MLRLAADARHLASRYPCRFGFGRRRSGFGPRADAHAIYVAPEQPAVVYIAPSDARVVYGMPGASRIAFIGWPIAIW